MDGVVVGKVTMPSISVAIDASQLAAWAEELGVSKLKSVLATAVTSAARLARKQTVEVIAADIGVSPSQVKSVGKVIRASPSSLRASFITTKQRIGILNVSSNQGFTRGSLYASTERLTGGGSASLQLNKAFLIRTAAGGQFVAIRRGKGRGNIKAVFAESPSTAIGQPGAAARLAWEKSASKEVETKVSVGVEAALNNLSLPSATPD